MSYGVVLGVIGAVIVHVAILLFGGILFMADDGGASTREVELVSAVEAEKEKEDMTKPEEHIDEQIEETPEEIPDAEDLVRNLEVAPINDAPALAEASLSAIEAALNGAMGGGSGDMGSAMDFSSGGRIGGKGIAGMASEKIDEAFTLSEIDQGPRTIYQVEPRYPSEFRGKKTEGSVTLLFVVDASGKVASPRVAKSSHAAFEKSALDAIKQWKFEAGVKGGERVACRQRLVMSFKPVR